MGTEVFSNSMASIGYGVQRTGVFSNLGQKRAVVVTVVESKPAKIVSSQSQEEICR